MKNMQAYHQTLGYEELGPTGEMSMNCHEACEDKLCHVTGF